MKQQPASYDKSLTKSSSRPKVVVKKKGQKYGDYVNEDGEKIKAQGFRFFGFFGQDKHDKKQIDRKRIHNLIPQNNNRNRHLGFITHKEIFGNHKRGREWINEQKKRHEGGDVYDDKKQIEKFEFGEDDQIIYIQPSVAEKRLEELRRMGRPFYDEDFPPNQYSLSGPYGTSSQWAPIKWAKISNHLNHTQIFKGKIQPNDIKQGYLGDCYFLAGLAAICERPDRIFSLFLLNEVNNMKYFSLKMIYRGKWRTIDLDEYIPFIQGEPAFSKTNDNELWVIILEKAWAKLYGSYKQLQGGFPQEPLHDLTGAPIKHIFMQRTSPNGDQQWKYLYQASLKEYSMVASSQPGHDTNQSPSGIFQGHAYTFLNAVEIQYNNRIQRIVQLRNPWGQGQFKGRWSDKDPIWRSISESQKRRIGFKERDEDGIFFMSFDDFMYEFRNVTIAEINDNASYVYQSFIDQRKKGVFFAVQIKHSGTYSFQVDKTPERSFTGEMQQRYKYPEAWLELGKLQKSNVIKEQGYISRRRTLFREYVLEPGIYIAWVKVDFNPTFEKDYQVVLAIYSQYASKIRLATREQAIKFTGDQRTEWTGQKNKVDPHYTPKYDPSPHNISPHNINFNYNFSKVPYEDTKKETEKPGSKQNTKQIVKKNDNIGTLNNENRVLPYNKKIRRIETQHTKIETIEEDENGEAIIRIQDNQTKKQSISNMGNTKTKTSNYEIQSTEIQFEGVTLMKKERNKETVKLEERLPNGKVIEKVETREKDVEVFEEDDDGTESWNLEGGSSLNNIENQPQNSKMNTKPSVQRYANKSEMQDSIYNSDEFNNRNIIRYAQPDQQELEVQTSFLNKK